VIQHKINDLIARYNKLVIIIEIGFTMNFITVGGVYPRAVDNSGKPTLGLEAFK
jgi:hypothetical protein